MCLYIYTHTYINALYKERGEQNIKNEMSYGLVSQYKRNKIKKILDSINIQHSLRMYKKTILNH